MAPDNARAVPQPVLDPAAQDIALPTPRPPVLERAAPDVARPVLEPAAQDIARPAPAPVHGPRAGWILSSVVAAAAAWAVGWVAGVSWAWREMTPGYWGRTHRRRGASLPGVGSPVRSR
jgi:hypothetical protein